MKIMAIKKILCQRAVFSVILGTSSICAYGSFGCTGSVINLGIGADGSVDIQLVGLPLNVVCNLKTQGSYAFDTQTCKALYATVLSAKTTGQSVTIFYGDSSYSCSTITPWSSMPSAYFILGPNG